MAAWLVAIGAISRVFFVSRTAALQSLTPSPTSFEEERPRGGLATGQRRRGLPLGVAYLNFANLVSTWTMESRRLRGL